MRTLPCCSVGVGRVWLSCHSSSLLRLLCSGPLPDWALSGLLTHHCFGPLYHLLLQFVDLPLRQYPLQLQLLLLPLTPAWMRWCAAWHWNISDAGCFQHLTENIFKERKLHLTQCILSSFYVLSFAQLHYLTYLTVGNGALQCSECTTKTDHEYSGNTAGDAWVFKKTLNSIHLQNVQHSSFARHFNSNI